MSKRHPDVAPDSRKAPKPSFARENLLPNGRTLGAPRQSAHGGKYVTDGGVSVSCAVGALDDPHGTVEAMVEALDAELGCFFQSSYEFPGRYARWTMGFVRPPLVFEAWQRSFQIRALNERGAVLLPAILAALQATPEVEAPAVVGRTLAGRVAEAAGSFTEEERSQQPSIFTVVRAITKLFACAEESQLGLYGSFGYDLTFQFEPVKLKHTRDPKQRDLVLFLPDEIVVLDILSNHAWRLSYDFEVGGRSTVGLPREGASVAYLPKPEAAIRQRRDHAPGAFARKVERAKQEFAVGNLFECVLSQTFTEPCPSPPSTVFRRLRARNPSPYGFLINLGEREYLVGASPEMFVRVEKNSKGWRVETCPISGTIRRGRDALEDAENIKKIIADKKEESELTMCTDVDRNDKSRICVAGSVNVIGRRQIEMYSRLIHTVDHVEGYLRDGYDAMDAFLVHTWAVTVTGAPKAWAIQFVEDQEESPRAWYGGAVGMIGFDGHLNTGLTLRTVRLKDGVAEVRAGATLLYDSEPVSEEKETELKASAMRDAVLRADPVETASRPHSPSFSGAAGRIVLVDHQDSFVHTLANYLRQTGAQVTTLRAGFEESVLDQLQPDLIVLSPGPGCPKDFDLARTISLAIDRKLPIFGVCLGLQGIVEYFGGELGVLSYPQHGKPSMIKLCQPVAALFEGLPDELQVARYHSLHSLQAKQPSCLRTTAVSSDGVVMAIEHTSLPIAAVQFHPESILTATHMGMQMLTNATKMKG